MEARNSASPKKPEEPKKEIVVEASTTKSTEQAQKGKKTPVKQTPVKEKESPVKQEAPAKQVEPAKTTASAPAKKESPSKGTKGA